MTPSTHADDARGTPGSCGACLALQVSQCQREPGITPDVVTYTTSMKACARGGQEEKVWSLFRAAKDLVSSARPRLTLSVFSSFTLARAAQNARKHDPRGVLIRFSSVSHGSSLPASSSLERALSS